MLAVHRQTVTHAEQHLDALRTVAATSTSVVEATAALTAALAEHGFADAEQARAAALPETEVRRLEELCAAYERARAEAETVLADPEVRAAADAPPPDVAALKEAAAAAQVALLHAKDAETLARRTLAAVARLRDELVRQCEALGPDAARHALLRELADTVAGTSANNTLRMRLSLVRPGGPAGEGGHAGQRAAGGHGRGPLPAPALRRAWPHAVPAAAWASRSSTSGPGTAATPPPSRAASRSWRRWPWPSASPTRSARRPAASTSRRCSSTRASARSTTRASSR